MKGARQADSGNRANFDSKLLALGIVAIAAIIGIVVTTILFVRSQSGTMQPGDLGASGLERSNIYGAAFGIDKCFAAGTMISMADGSSERIEKISPGDMVISYDESTGGLVKGKVTKVLQHPAGFVSYYLIVNGNLKLTANHPVFTSRGLVYAGNLRVGDSLINQEGSLTPVKSIEQVDESIPLYNLEVEPYHTYFTNGVAVHNKILG